jgi:NADH-quinone oxidoreductase subunit L
MEHKWWVDELYQAVIINPYMWLSRMLAQPVDRGIIDAAANGFGEMTSDVAQWWRKRQDGFVRTYALSIVIGVVVLLAYLVLR